MSCRPFPCVAAAIAACAAAGLLASEPGPNLVANPGFEAGLAGWEVDNWARNEVAVGPDAERPHGGGAAARVELRRILHEANLQLATGPLALHAERAVEIRFWARGVSNTAPLTTMVRRSGPPYTVYFRSDTTVTDEWRAFTYVISLPPEAVAEPVSLRLNLNGVGVFWLDDVSVRELPAQAEGPAPAANPVRNPSFEAGLDGWSASVRAREFAERWQESGALAPTAPAARLEVEAAADAPHGRRHLALAVPEGAYAALTSAYFPARYGHRARVTLALRGPAQRPVTVGIGGNKNGNARYQSSEVVCTGAWQRVAVDVVLKPVEEGLYHLRLSVPQGGAYAVDDVVVAEDGAAWPAQPAAWAVQADSGAPLGHLYAPGQAATFRAVWAGAAPGAEAACGWTVEDHRDRVLATGGLALRADADGGAVAGFRVPSDRQGAFRISLRGADGALLAEQLYSVLPDLPEPAARPESVFGGHVDLTPYNLAIARRAGFRWLRLHPPLATKWMAVEPSPGTWTFRTAEVQAAHAAGFRIIGSLDTAPHHAADVDRARARPARWLRSPPPADLAAWRRYVQLTARAFAPAVDAWEVWNEPDGDFLQVRPGQDKTAVILALVQAARAALDEVDPRLPLIAPALANPSATLGRELLLRGAGASLDGFSLHCYALAGGGASPDEGVLLPLLAGIAAARDRHGDPLAVWHTEGGVWLSGGQCRLATWNIPPSSALTPSQAAAAQVRSALLFKAAGARRHLIYQAWASPTGRTASEDNTCGMVEVTGIPGAGVAAHAALVALVDDAAPAGVHVHRLAAGTVREARFATPAGRLSAWWGDAGVPLAAVEPDPARVWDLMGNPQDAAGATIDEYPVYTLSAER